MEVAIAVAMLHKKQVKQFPLFLAFVVVHLVLFIVTYAAYRYSYRAYFYTYWGSIPVDVLTTLFVIEELYRGVLAPYRAVQGLGVVIFRFTAITLFAVAIGTAYAAPGTDSYRIVAGLVVIDRSAAFVEAGLLIVLFITCSVLGIAWRSYHFGIAAGMAVQASVGTAIACLRAQFGTGADVPYALGQALAFNLGMAVWLYYLVSARSVIVSHAEAGSRHLAAWNLALDGILHGNRTSVDH